MVAALSRVAHRQALSESEDHRMTFKCECGIMLASPVVGASVTCFCGRKYHPPSVDCERLLARVDDLANRVAVLEGRQQGPDGHGG